MYLHFRNHAEICSDSVEFSLGKTKEDYNVALELSTWIWAYVELITRESSHASFLHTLVYPIISSDLQWNFFHKMWYLDEPVVGFPAVEIAV